MAWRRQRRWAGGGLHDQAVGFDNGRIGGERTSASDLIKSFRDDRSFAAVMAAVEGLYYFWAHALNGIESGPGLQKIARLNGGDIADPVQSLWEILFQ